MLIYIGTIFILGIFALIDNVINSSKYSKLRKVFYFVAFLIVAFQFGLRDEIGTDWKMYESFFNFRYLTFNDLEFSNYAVEIGFQFLQILFHFFSDDYNMFVLFQSIVFYAVLFFIIYRWSDVPFLAIMLFYSLLMGTVGANRQYIALAFCLIGLYYYLKTKNYYVFFGFIGIAFFFHISALIFALYFFLDRKFDTKLILLVILSCFVIGNTQLPIKIFSVFGGINEHALSKSTAYLNSAEEELEKAQVSAFGIAKRIILPLVFIFFRDRISIKEKYYNLFLNGYIVGTCIYFLFYKTLLVMISRGGFYFNIMEPLVTASLVFVVNRKFRPILVVFFIIISIFYLNQSISAYPEIFVPYKSIISK